MDDVKQQIDAIGYRDALSGYISRAEDFFPFAGVYQHGYEHGRRQYEARMQDLNRRLQAFNKAQDVEINREVSNG